MKAKRPVGVTLSSTFSDLEEKRQQVLAFMGRHEFHDIAMESDAALPTLDKIASSLFKVDQAEAYVCIIGYRYGTREFCETRNPQNLSLTELEWRRAKERDIPRCTLIMSPRYSELQLADIESVSAEDRRSLVAFRELAESDMVYASFDNDADFQVKAMQSLEQLRRDIEARDVAKEAAQSLSPQLAAALSTSANPDDRLPTVAPGFHFVRKPYVENQRFAGRVSEIAQIDSWATSKDAMLLFQAIGGMGKSMLTWHWAKNHSTDVRSDWSGRLWYSFYEQGADLNDFCVHALAYMRGRPPKTFRGCRTIDLGDELRRELDARPWILILDGLERVLVAYNRADKDLMSDDDASIIKDGLGLDRDPRSCFRPEDDEVLAMLAQADRGKLLASSRLIPTALTNAGHQPIPGVSRIALEGLTPVDAEQVLTTMGVRGDSWRMQKFLDENFACHPLSVGIVAGQVMTFLEARGDFDTWVDHPQGGAEPAMLVKDLRGRQNHILARAFDGLDDDEKALVGAIAMVNFDLTMDVLRIINPKRPIKPKMAEKPEIWTEEELYYNTNNPEIDRAYLEWREASSPKTRAEAHRILENYRDENLQERTKKYETYLAHYDWQQKATDADEWLLRTLPGLESRGLLQFDASSETLDMHPAIRHTAMYGLSPEARSSTGSHVSDSLSSRPAKPYDQARTLDDLATGLTRVQALNAAGRFDASWALLVPELGEALMRLERTDELAEILHSYFPEGWDRPPRKITKHPSKSVDPLRWALIVLSNAQISRRLQEEVLHFDLASGDATLVCRGVCRLTLLDTDIAPVVHRFGLLTLAKRLADACGFGELQYFCLLQLAEYHLARGDLSSTHSCLEGCQADWLEGYRGNSYLTRMRPWLRPSFRLVEVKLARRSGRITPALLESALKLVRSLGEVFFERLILEQVAEWHGERGAHVEALAAYNDLIALANMTSARYLVPFYTARRGHSLIALGRTDEAWPIVLKFEKDAEEPNLVSAEHYLALGDHLKAREHALGAYRVFWGDGPPFQHHWPLEDCRRVLAAVGAAEPTLPSCDPLSIEPFDFEADVERLIEKILTEKAERGKKEDADGRMEISQLNAGREARANDSSAGGGPLT
jgi:hypothetical protein